MWYGKSLKHWEPRFNAAVTVRQTLEILAAEIQKIVCRKNEKQKVVPIVTEVRASVRSPACSFVSSTARPVVCSSVRMHGRSFVRPSVRSTVRPTLFVTIRPLVRHCAPALAHPPVRPSPRPIVRSLVRSPVRLSVRPFRK